MTETKTYNARLATRLTSSVDTRLRQLALLRRCRISHLLDDVLDAGAAHRRRTWRASWSGLRLAGHQPRPWRR